MAPNENKQEFSSCTAQELVLQGGSGVSSNDSIDVGG